MTTLSLLDHSSSPDESASPEVCTPSPPCSPTFEVFAEEVCSESPVKTTVKSPSAGSRAAAVRERGKLGFPDCVYSCAASVFQVAHVEKPLAVIHYSTTTTQVNSEDSAGAELGKDFNTKQNELWAYELAFNALKFQEILEDVLIDSCFYPSQQTPPDLMALLIVMVYDLQDRKFQPRQPMTGEGEEPIEDVRRVESSLFSFRTKLAASLARYRIKQNLLSIEDMLPKTVREKHKRKQKLPLSTWVNTLNSSVEEVCEKLKEAGFVQAEEMLEETLLLTNCNLIMEAKSRSLAVSTVHPLLVKDADILMVGSFSVQTLAHVAVQASACATQVQVCGMPCDPAHREELQAMLCTIGCKNVHFLSEEFAELNEWDSRVQKVRVILLLPQCTTSGLSDHIQHILHENGDRELLQGLSRGVVSDVKLDSLVSKQMQALSHALSCHFPLTVSTGRKKNHSLHLSFVESNHSSSFFPKVQAVVYCTCSVYEEENELLVKTVLKNASVRPKLRPFRMVCTEWKEGGEENFFRLKESDSSDGCFICVLKREQEPTEPETVQDILARAAAKGLLGGLLAPETSEQIKPKKRQKQKGAAALLPPLAPLQPKIPDTSGLLNDPNAPNSAFIKLPTAYSGHITAASAASSSALHTEQSPNLADEDSLDSYCSSFVLNDVYTALDQASAAVNKATAGPDLNSIVKNEPAKQKGRKRKTKAQRRRKNRSKSHTRTSKAHRSRKRLLHRQSHRQTSIRTHALAPPVTAVQRLPAPPPGKQPLKASPKQCQSLQRRLKQEASQKGLDPQPSALDLNGVLKLKKEVERYEKEVIRSIQTVLPPISASGRTLISSSDSSTPLLPSSITSWSTGSYLSSTLSLPSSRSQS